MAKIQPFRAIRPTRDKVSLVSSRSYQSYSQEELESRMNYNPYSFLHIINPGYKFQKEISGEERYRLVKNRYLEFKEEETFIKDRLPGYYLYKIVTREKEEFCGLIAAASTDDYERDSIKKHENTIQYREETFMEYLNYGAF